MKDPFIFEKSILENGLTVVSKQIPGKKRVDMGFVVHAGAYQDPAGKSGLAHFVEHLAPHNSGLSISQILKNFDLAGGFAELGETRFFDTSYQFCCPLENFEDSLDFFGKFLTEALFDKKAVTNEKPIIINEFGEKYACDRDYKKHMIQLRELYRDTILAEIKGVVGSRKDIRNITHHDLQEFYNTYYTPQNMSVVVLSSLKKEDLLKKINSSPLGKRKSGKRITLPKPADFENILPSDYTERRRSKVSSGMIQVNHLLPKKFPRGTVQIFEKFVSDLLFNRIREEKRVAYQANLDIIDHVSFYESVIYIPSFELKSKNTIWRLIMETIEQAADNEEFFEEVKKITINKFDLYEHSAEGILSSAMEMLSFNHTTFSKKELRNVLKGTTFQDMIEISACYKNGRSFCILETP